MVQDYDRSYYHSCPPHSTNRYHVVRISFYVAAYFGILHDCIDSREVQADDQKDIGILSAVILCSIADRFDAELN